LIRVYVESIDRQGLDLRSSLRFQLGEQLKLFFPLPLLERATMCLVLGTVASREGDNIRLSFLDLPQDVMALIENHLKRWG
jgi:hypothetical protein